MSVLGFLVLASLLGCGFAHVPYHRSGRHFCGHHRQPHAYQWEVLKDHVNSYQPRYHDSYYYNYPSPAKYVHKPEPKPHKQEPKSYKPEPKPHMPDIKHCSSHEEGQKYLQLYRLIRVIDLFRAPPKYHKKITSLDKLVQQLTKQSLQDELVKLVRHVEGYEQVTQLEHGHPDHEMYVLVNDDARLLLTIQKTLNALDLDDYDDHYHDQQHRDHHYQDHQYRDHPHYDQRYHDHHYQNQYYQDPHYQDDHYQYHKHDDYQHRDHRYEQQHKQHHGCCYHHKELCYELRQLRDQANSLKLSHLKKQPIKGHAFQSKSLDNLDQQQQQYHQQIEEQMLNEFAAAMERFVQEQVIDTKYNQMYGKPQQEPAPFIDND
nr:histidine-rich glycoprotein-like [Aedes albopictus]